jgi:hypothetical protein
LVRHLDSEGGRWHGLTVMHYRATSTFSDASVVIVEILGSRPRLNALTRFLESQYRYPSNSKSSALATDSTNRFFGFTRLQAAARMVV